MQPILKIDLSRSKVSEYVPPDSWVRDFLGAASLAARILYDEITPELDPLSPNAPLLFLNGPLTGTAGPAVGRFVVTGKSPATGLWAESNCGGFWGPELRKTGYDGVWITGKAEGPVYVWVQAGSVEIRGADHLWGLDTYQCQSFVQQELANESGQKNVRVATIGPAGEHQIPFALIHCDHGRVAGRTGLGAVMGAKNLKAIAVKGNQQIPLIDWAAYKPVRARTNRELRDDISTRGLRELGTAATSDYFDYLGEMPKKYFSSGEFAGTTNVSGSAFAETILSGVSACHACVIACGRVVTLEDGKKRKGPEYETIIGFGPNLLIDDTHAITMMGEWCDRYGLDTISMSNTLGLAFKLFEMGCVTEKDTDGLRLEWGNVDAALACVHLTGRMDGFGAMLAQGAVSFAEQFGAPEEAVHVNGLEAAYHDPRGMSGMSLVYATSPRGACHNQSDYFMIEIGNVEEALGMSFFQRHVEAEKAANVAIHQNWRTVGNALVLCQFANVPARDVLSLVNTALGLDWSLEDLMRSGERGWNLKRAINNRLGLTRANDKLPKAFLEPYEEGGAAGYVPNLQVMLNAYYETRGWDPSSGFPTREKLRELDLHWVEEDLWPKN